MTTCTRLVTQEVIIASVTGVLLGWPVAGVAFSPYALYILFSPRLLRSVRVFLFTALPILGGLAAADAYFYGRLTVRQARLATDDSHCTYAAHQ